VSRLHSSPLPAPAPCSRSRLPLHLRLPLPCPFLTPPPPSHPSPSHMSTCHCQNNKPAIDLHAMLVRFAFPLRAWLPSHVCICVHDWSPCVCIHNRPPCVCIHDWPFVFVFATAHPLAFVTAHSLVFVTAHHLTFVFVSQPPPSCLCSHSCLAFAFMPRVRICNHLLAFVGNLPPLTCVGTTS
jgi:hypothetical protein